MTILIDSRIGSRELLPLLPSPKSLTTLEYGDAAWMGNGPDGPMTAWVGVERKRLRDLLSSMESGRLTTHQLAGMANAYHHSYVVVEGIWRPDRYGVVEIPIGKGKWGPLKLGSRSFTASTMDNFANSLSCILGVTVVFTPSLERTAGWMSNIYRWWTGKKWDQHRSCAGKQTCRGLPVVGMGKAPLVARVAMELRGVSVVRAMALAERFPSVSALCAGSIEDVMGVEGIGRSTAESVVRELRGNG